MLCNNKGMKRMILSIAVATLALSPLTYADELKVSKDKDVSATAREKMSELDRKAHNEMCKGNHGKVTDKSSQTISIDGKQYALKINTPVNKQEEPLLPKTMKVGDKVCYDLAKAADGSKQITKLMAIDDTADRSRVREKNTDAEVEVKSSPSKVEVETPNKKIEVK